MPAPADLPAAPLLWLLKQAGPAIDDPAATMNAAKAALDPALTAQSLADLNAGQYAALLHRVAVDGVAAFAASNLCRLVNAGNFTLALGEFAAYGDVGGFERIVWLVGNS